MDDAFAFERLVSMATFNGMDSIQGPISRIRDGGKLGASVLLDAMDILPAGHSMRISEVTNPFRLRWLQRFILSSSCSLSKNRSV